jgi:hypothetical protein
VSAPTKGTALKIEKAFTARRKSSSLFGSLGAISTDP